MLAHGAPVPVAGAAAGTSGVPGLARVGLCAAACAHAGHVTLLCIPARMKLAFKLYGAHRAARPLRQRRVRGRPCLLHRMRGGQLGKKICPHALAVTCCCCVPLVNERNGTRAAHRGCRSVVPRLFGTAAAVLTRRTRALLARGRRRNLLGVHMRQHLCNGSLILLSRRDSLLYPPAPQQSVRVKS